MEWLLAISFGELFLKGKNRHTFFSRAKRNIEKNIKDIEYDSMYMEGSVLYIKADFEKLDFMIPEIQ